MSRAKSNTTALQKLKVKQAAELKALPRSSPSRVVIKAKHKLQIESLKHDQNLIARARAALPKNKRKKLKSVKHLSKSTIQKEARKVKENGAKLKEKKEYITAPKRGRVTEKCFRLPGEAKKATAYINQVVKKYEKTGGVDGQIRAYRARFEYSDGTVKETALIDPDEIESFDDVYENVAGSDPTFDMSAPQNVADKVCIIISWNLDYLKSKSGWSEYKAKPKTRKKK